jgi:hypothetical protein
MIFKGSFNYVLTFYEINYHLAGLKELKAGLSDVFWCRGVHQPLHLPDHLGLNQASQPRQAQPVRQLEQLDAALPAQSRRTLVRVQEVQQLRERVLLHTRKFHLK